MHDDYLTKLKTSKLINQKLLNQAGEVMIAAIMEEKWEENPKELGLMALFYVAGVVALKYDRK
jgi:hypothetical protein